MYVRARLAVSCDLQDGIGIPIHSIITHFTFMIGPHNTHIYAKLCGVSARTLQDIERGESSPTLATAEKLLRPMGMVVSAVPKRRQAER